MSNQHGGPAFPLPNQYLHKGMSLRDYFAGQVLAATDSSGSPASEARWAYQVADAMLEEREL